MSCLLGSQLVFSSLYPGSSNSPEGNRISNDPLCQMGGGEIVLACEAAESEQGSKDFVSSQLQGLPVRDQLHSESDRIVTGALSGSCPPRSSNWVIRPFPSAVCCVPPYAGLPLLCISVVFSFFSFLLIPTALFSCFSL